MNKIYKLAALLLSILLLGACGNKATLPEESGEFDISDIINSSEGSPDSALYGTTLNNALTNNKETLYSENGKIEIAVGLSNEFSAAQYGFIVFVDGIRVPFTVKEIENCNESLMHIISMKKGEKDRVITVSFSDEYFAAERDCYVSIATVLNPNYLIKSTDYISFLPHHALAAYNFYKVRKTNGDSPFFSVSRNHTVYTLPESINALYEQTKGTESDPYGKSPLAEKTNSLDNTSEFILSSNNNFEAYTSCFACEKSTDFTLNIGCLGKSDSYRLSLYVNNELVPAFDGCLYCDITTERNKLKVIEAKISAESLKNYDEFNSLYLIAVPLNPSLDENDYTRPLKAASKLLYISENAEKVNELNEKYGSPEPSEEYSEVTGISKASSKTETSKTGSYSTQSETKANAAQAQTAATEYPLKNARGIWAFDNGTVLVQCRDWTIRVFDPETGTLTDKKINGGYDVKKLTDGLALIDSFNFSFKIYNTELKLLSEGEYPYNVMSGDEGALTVSNDGKSVIYEIKKSGSTVKNIYIDSIPTGSATKICTLTSSPSLGEVGFIDEFHSFDGKNALFTGAYAKKVTSNGDITYSTCHGTISKSGVITKWDSPSDFNTSNTFGNTLFVTDIGEFDGKVDMINLYSGKSTVTFNEACESYSATASQNLKYIASQSRLSGSNAIMLKIYEYSTMKVLYEKTISAAGRLPIDFCEKDSCAYILTNEKIIKVNL